MIRELYRTQIEENEVCFIYFGWAGILLRTKTKTVAIDLGEKCLSYNHIASIQTLDLQLYSHTHWDHFGRSTTKKLFEVTQAPIVAEPDVAAELTGDIPSHMLTSSKSGEEVKINGFTIKAVAGVHPRPITVFRVEWDECKLFHGADSGYVPLTEYGADLAFIPTGTPSPSCSPENGLKMVLDIQPRIAVAMHGSKKQMQKFRDLVGKNLDRLPNTQVVFAQVHEILSLSFSNL
ncbi:MAG: MBL fold metallo-hydrolase [Candidatus Thorarchaeota archaeon]